jgi:hypothetical protein
MATVVVAVALSVITASNTQASIPIAAGAVQHTPFTSLDDVFQVSADAVDDAWAIGEDYPQSVVLHWDGSAWGTVPFEIPSGDTVGLTSVTAISPNDVWVVGELGEGVGVSKTLTEHWDGSAFTIVPSPNVTTRADSLAAVSASAPNDVWTVGDATSGDLPIIEHWDGTQWSLVPMKRSDAGMTSVHAIAPDDVWAAGFSGGPDFAVHWNGHHWHNSKLPGFGEMAGTSSDDLWAAAGHQIFHWNGTRWSSRRQGPDIFASVTVPGATDVWAVGWVGYSRPKPVVAHWDGQRWTKYTVLMGGQLGFIEDISAVSPTDIWAVGRVAGGSGIVLHWDGTSWQQYPV